MRPLLAPGMRWSSLAQAAVQAILGSKHISRQVTVTGDRFLNQDTWYNLSYAKFILSAVDKGANLPLPMEVMRVAENHFKNASFVPSIFISRVEDADPKKGCALVGGCHHEAFHTLYSLRKDTSKSIQELKEVLNEAKNLPQGWGKFAYDWYLYLEDVRIERLGRREFPGSFVPLCNLQDYILEKETSALDHLSREDALQIIFRDLGYGYSTKVSQGRLEEYRRRFPDIVDMCLRGPFSALLEEIRNPPEKKLLFALVMAIRCSILAAQEGFQAPSKPTEITCIKISGIKSTSPSDSSGSGSGSWSGDSESDGEGSNSEGSKNSSHSGSKDSSHGGESEKDESDSTGEGLDEDIEDFGTSPSSKSKEDKDGNGKISASLLAEDFAITSSDDDRLLSTIFGSPSPDSPTNSTTAATNAQFPREFEKGEAPWNPHPSVNDQLVYVTGSDFSKVSQAYQEALKCINPLRSRFQALLERMSYTETFHGVEKGEGISEEMIIETSIALMSGKTPMEAFYHIHEGIHFEPAIAVCLDGSDSMTGNEMIMMAATLAILEPLDALGAKTLLFKIAQSGYQSMNVSFPYHRSHSVAYEVFKTWDEDIRSQRGRLGMIEVNGSTPLADGMQFGIQALNDRTETPKIMFVLTDGEPNYGTEKVVRYLDRSARTMGIQVIAVGIGPHTRRIPQIFKEYIIIKDFDTLAAALIKKLSEVFLHKR